MTVPHSATSGGDAKRERAAAFPPSAIHPPIKSSRAESEPGWPWWLWPHLLSLDAPLVALVWQRWWARAARAPLRPAQEAVLFLGVWLIYLADRLADTRAGTCGGHGTARHAFYRAHWRMMRAAAGLAALTLMVISPVCLRASEFRAGLGLLAVAGGYFWLVHIRPPPGRAGGWPKEAAVGAIFSVGTGFFALCARQPPSADLLLGLALFGVLCALNCVLITKWEHTPCDLGDPASLWNTFPHLLHRGGGACLGLAATALLAAAVRQTSVFTPVALGALLLVFLDRRRGDFSRAALRVLADAALLAPLLRLAAAPGKF